MERGRWMRRGAGGRRRPVMATTIAALGVLVVAAAGAVVLAPVAVAATPTFIQAGTQRITSGTTDSLAFPGANVAGDLSVVYVSWSNTASVSVTDTRGNTYTSVSPATHWGTNNAWSSQVFYAKNIAAGTNTVTATFATAVTSFGEISIDEYANIDKVNPVDVSAAAIGTSSAMNSGAATTTNAGDLIFGAGSSSSSVSAAGTGFTSRTNANGSRTEDKNVTTVGSYNATATQNGTRWVMHMVAFKSADTTAPSAPSGLTAAAVSDSQVNLAWSASTDNTAVAGYQVERCEGTGCADFASVATATTSSYSDIGLTGGTNYGYRVRATDAAGNSSGYSTVVTVTTLAGPDTTPPSASMTAPASGTSVSGTVAVSAIATDNVAIAEVEFLLDGVSIGTDTTSPYSVQWDTRTTTDGSHALSARARDASGNFGVTSGVATVQVSNGSVPPLPPNLVAGWSLDEGQGNSTADVSGNGNTATFQQDPAWTTGRYGSGVRFDGVHDYLSVPNSPTLNISGSALTFSTWINPLGGGSDQVVFGKFWSTAMSSPYYQYGLELQYGGATPVFEIGTAGGALDANMGSPLPIGQWSHLAVTFDGSTVRFYLNASLLSSRALTATITPRDSVLYVGSDVSPGQFFNGTLDDFRIYNRTLTQADNQADMNTPLGAGSADPTAPTVAITYPASNAQVGGIITVSADASDDTAVAGVQFFVDGNAVGPEDATAPYGANWDTRTVTNGAHTLTARARDTAGNVAVATPVNVNVANGDYFQNEILATGFNLPTVVKFLPDGRMLVAELPGKIKVVPPPYTTPDANLFLDLDLNISGYAGLQQGIFDVALDPNFTANHYFYVFYTNDVPNRDRLSRFTANADLTGTVPGSESILYEDPQTPNTEHHGGAIAFANDGKIFFTTGDHFEGTPSQDLTSPRGKVHRINPDGTVPTDNPFYDGAGPNWDSVWALGLRNPYRASYDAATGRLFIGDVGGNTTDSIEEVNLGARGANYGWPNFEGPCSAPCTSPIYSYNHNGRDAAVTGGFVYHGSVFPTGMDGSYFFGDYAQNWIKRLTFDVNGNVSGVSNFEPADGSSDGPTGDVVYLTEGPDGALYYVDLGYSDTTGTFGISKVRRIRYFQSNRAPIAVASASPASGPLPLNVSFSSAGSSDPEGQPIAFSWDFGDGTLSTEANPVHTYTVAGQYTVRLTVSDGTNSTFSTPIVVQAGSPPTATILGPVDGAAFRAGDVINFSGDATDPEDGTLPDSAFSWTVDFLHDGHVHPGATTTGRTGGFSIPTSGHDFEGNTRYRISLTVTDSDGLTNTKSVTVWPDKVNLSFDASPSGLQIYVDGIARTTPFVLDTLIGFNHTVEARNQTDGSGSSYNFASWSDGGGQMHTITVPVTAASYTATFSLVAPPTGLRAAWGFNAGSGTTATDSSGNGNVLTLLNGTAWATGKYGSALRFDGTNDYLTAPNSTSLDVTGNALTLSMWLNPSTSGSGDQVVIGKHWNTTMTSPYYQYGLELQNNGVRPVFEIGSSGGLFEANSGTNLTRGVWSHVAVVFNGTSTKFYVNGVLTSTVNGSATITSRPNPLRVGADANTGQFYKGMLDDLRIYSTAQTAAQVQADMSTGL